VAFVVADKGILRNYFMTLWEGVKRRLGVAMDRRTSWPIAWASLAVNALSISLLTGLAFNVGYHLALFSP